MKFSGRSYADRKTWCCEECKRTVPQLATAHVIPAYLRICGKVGCHHLLCWPCKATHEAMHELAGETVDDPWEKRMEKRLNVLNRI